MGNGNKESCLRRVKRIFPNVIIGLSMFMAIVLTDYDNVWESTMAVPITLIAVFSGAVAFIVGNLLLGQRQIVLNGMDMAFIIVLSYGTCILLIKFSFDYAFYNIKWLLLYGTAYFLGRSMTNDSRRSLLFKTICLIAVFQVVWALYEVGEAHFDRGLPLGRLPRLLKGSLSNSSMLACLMAMGSIIGLYFWRKERSNFFKVFWMLGTISMAAILFLTTSRAAILMLVSGMAVLSGVKKRYIGIGAILLVIGLLSFKKDSVQGRVLIWKVSMQMVKDNPVFGIGPNRFGAEYNNYQGRYFSTHKASEKERLLAGDNFYAFNLPIRIWVELGLVGLVLCAWLLVLTVKRTKGHPLVGGLLSGLLVFSLFSYPLAQTETSLLVFVLLGTAGTLKRIGTKKVRVRHLQVMVFLCLFLIFGIYREAGTIGAIKQWKRYNGYRYTSPAMAITLFGKTHPRLKGHPEFLYAYGTLLVNNNSNERAIELLERSTHRIPTSHLYSYLGLVYGNLKKDSLAQYNHSFACEMVPSLFVPRYHLFLFYRDRGQTEQALEIARTILDMPVKINSKKIYDIKKEVSNFAKYSKQSLR